MPSARILLLTAGGGVWVSDGDRRDGEWRDAIRWLEGAVVYRSGQMRWMYSQKILHSLVSTTEGRCVTPLKRNSGKYL